MNRIIAIALLVLAGCPDETQVTPEEPFDFFAGEGTEWRWGTAGCVVYMRDGGAPAQARWFGPGQLIRRGPLNGHDSTDDFRRGFYLDENKPAIELGEGQGAYVKRFFYDADDRLIEIVRRPPSSMQTLHTYITYDTQHRMIERTTERPSMTPLLERWTYAPIGAVESYTAESNGTVRDSYVVVRAPSGRVESVRRISQGREMMFSYDYGATSYLPLHVHIVAPGDGRSPYDADYEYDEQHRTIAKTLRSATTEYGERIELVWGDKEVIEKRDLTPNGLLRARRVYDRRTNGDVTLSIDDDADGEPERFADLRDECGSVAITDFATTFMPRIPLDGETPYRPDPFVEAN